MWKNTEYEIADSGVIDFSGKECVDFASQLPYVVRKVHFFFSNSEVRVVQTEIVSVIGFSNAIQHWKYLVED